MIDGAVLGIRQVCQLPTAFHRHFGQGEDFVDFLCIDLQLVCVSVILEQLLLYILRDATRGFSWKRNGVLEFRKKWDFFILMVAVGEFIAKDSCCALYLEVCVLKFIV